MGLDINYSDGQTPLEEEEKDGLLINSVTTRGELDEFEQLGVEKANEWLLNRNFGFEKILTEDFAKNLHRIMFADVWSWAGEFRKTNKSIEVDKSMITIELKNLFDDCKYWIENKTFSEDEIAVRLSHRIVLIHPFANGNGRHSRLIADILINKGFGKSYFTWGSKSLIKIGEARSVYLKALREADNLDYDALILFARS
ncbi:MAG TPA: mobile mystery protein B [Ignavibacteriaceae bacterium]|nr:mobile mystery protein B [Ignavibacteriaceae bacterium]